MVDITTITPQQRTVSRFGWKPPLPDPRYRARARFSRSSRQLPPRGATSTSSFMPPVWDQGNEGSCTAHGGGGGYAYARAKQGCSPLWTPSRSLTYWATRTAEGTSDQDSGASVQDTIKTFVRVGACDETLFPYVVGGFAKTPPDSVFAEAALHRATKAVPVMQSPDELRGCIDAGFPFPFGFVVWTSFEAIDSGGIMPVPDPDTEHTLGGHCVLGCDYDDDMQEQVHGAPIWSAPGAYKCRNSWSERWGLGGYFWMPYEVAHDPNFASDFWQIDAVAA